MKKIIIGLCLMSLALNMGSADAKAYKVGMVSWAGFSPANVADAKGLWKHLGLDVTVFMLNSNAEVQKALAQRQIDIAIDINGFWVDMTMQGTPIKIIAEIDWSNGGDKILVKKGVNPSDLKDKILGTYDDSSATLVLLNRFLRDHGLRMSDIKRVVFAAERLPEKFRALNLAAVVSYDPYALEIEQSQDGQLVASSATYPGCIADSIAMRADVLQAAPREDIVAFLKGWIAAVEWLQNETNWTEFAQILNQQTFKGSEPQSDDVLRGILARVKIHDAAMLWQQHQTGSGIFLQLQELKMALSENQLLKQDFTPEALVDASYLMEALGGQQ